MPTVSVIMSVFRADDKDVLAAVNSIINQTYKDWELIIYGDGAAGHTMKQLRRAASKDARIHIFCSRKNHGAGYARNACLRFSNGKYIAVMDADDVSDVHRLEVQVRFLEKHLEYAFAGSNVMLIDNSGIWGMRMLEEIPSKKSFLSTMPFVHPSIMFRRKVMEELHGYEETADVGRAEDYDLLMRIYAEGYKGYNIQKFLFYYREDISAYKKRKYRYRIMESRVRYRNFKHLGILKGNYRYVLKPLIAGAVPNRMMHSFHCRRYRTKKRCMKKRREGAGI